MNYWKRPEAEQRGLQAFTVVFVEQKWKVVNGFAWWLERKLSKPFTIISLYFYVKQERPPAWTQEAYRPPCSKYSICCPNWVPSPCPDLAGGYLTWVPPCRVPPGRVPPSRVHPPAGYPTGRVPPWQGTPLAGPGRVPPQAGPGRVPPPRWLPHGILGNVAMHYGIWVPPQVWTN